MLMLMTNLITKLATALKPKRRWTQFSLATMFVVVTALCVWLSAHVRATNRQRAALAAIKELGGRWFYDYQLNDDGITYNRHAPPVPKWLLDRFGIDHFASADRIELRDPKTVSVALLEVKKLGSLRSLWVRIGTTTRLTPTDVELIASMTGVRGMEFDPETQTDALVEAIERLRDLEALQLPNFKISEKGLQRIAGMTKLTQLHINAAEVGDDGLAQFAESKLVDLHLYGPGVSDAGLARLAHLKSLRELHVCGTQITDAGLAHLRELSELRVLNVDSQITDAGLAHLSRLTKLRVLYVGSAQITDSGLTHLARLPRLERLGLYGTRASKAGVAELQKALPNCKIYQ